MVIIINQLSLIFIEIQRYMKHSLFYYTIKK